MTNSNSNGDVFARFCPDKPDLIEVWIERALSDACSLPITARCLAMVLAHRFAMGVPNPIYLERDPLMRSLGMMPWHLTARNRLTKALFGLEQSGLIRLHRREEVRDGKPWYVMTHAELLIGGAK